MIRGGVQARRDRARWIAAGVTTAVAVIAVAATLHAIVEWPANLGAVAIGSVAAPAIAGFASLWPRLSGHGGRALAQALSAGAFALLVAFVYLVVVRGLGNPPSANADRETLGLSMLAASIAAISFGPARRRLLRHANRLVFGAPSAPDELIRAFSSRLSRSTPMDELLLQLCESLVRSMELTRAEVYTGTGQVLERAAGVPLDATRRSVTVTDRDRPAVVRARVSAGAWAKVWLPELVPESSDAELRIAPIRNAGQLLGLLVVERGAAAEPFTEDDDTVLADLAREVGLALHNVQLDSALQDTLSELRVQAAELRESRARIVASGDAERRRLERDIHDGAQQNLAALAIELRLAHDLIARDPTAAAELLEGLNAQVQATIHELRELAHGIYPPLLADGGLGPALTAAAGRSPLEVAVDVCIDDRFDQNTEAAVYFCCLEALQNSAKHAPGATVNMRIWRDGGALRFEVVDDGPGFDPATTPKGQGLVNMTDRLGAIGGSIQWRSQPGQGAAVSGSVPVAGLAPTSG